MSVELKPGEAITYPLLYTPPVDEVYSSFVSGVTEDGSIFIHGSMRRFRVENEGVTWIRGTHSANSPAVAALLAAYALSTQQ